MFLDKKEDLGYLLPEVKMFFSVKEYQLFFREENVEEISEIMIRHLKSTIPINRIFFIEKQK